MRDTFLNISICVSQNKGELSRYGLAMLCNVRSDELESSSVLVHGFFQETGELDGLSGKSIFN